MIVVFSIICVLLVIWNIILTIALHATNTTTGSMLGRITASLYNHKIIDMKEANYLITGKQDKQH